MTGARLKFKHVGRMKKHISQPSRKVSSVRNVIVILFCFTVCDENEGHQTPGLLISYLGW